MFEDFLAKSTELKEKREPFATAIVVRDRAPSSGKPGDKAVIDKAGYVHGWIGGGCTRSIVVKEALSAISEGKSRLVRISPKQERDQELGVVDYKMTCYSGGTVEVFIEPVLPRPQLVILGKSIVARALLRIGKAMDYHVSCMANQADADLFPEADQIIQGFSFDAIQSELNPYVVVSTQGEQDELALEAAILSEASYISFVGSRKKANGVFRYLLGKGISGEKLAKVKSPAGLDIKARYPEEIAISILAEIIERRRIDQTDKKSATSEVPKHLYKNPVCGVLVDKASAKHTLEYKGEKVYFCCDGCKNTFEQSPESYLPASS